MELACQYWKAANQEKRKVLLLHGMGGTGALWRPIASALEDHSSILAPDQRGHGKSRILDFPKSEITRPYSPLDFGRDLVETLEKLDFHPVWAIGHSMGVRSACALASLKPEWIEGLILVDLGFSGAAGGGLGQTLREFLTKLPLRFQSRTEAKAFMEAECPDPAIARYLMAVSVFELDPLTRTKTGALTFPFDKDALIQTLDQAETSSVRTWIEALAQIQKPILALRGAESRVWSQEEFEFEVNHFRPFSSVKFETIPGAGHGLPFEKRAEFLERILKFMS